MKKYHVIDADGNNFQVEEMDEEICPECGEEKPEVADEGEALSQEEIGALKGLAAVADKLMALLQPKDSDEDMNEDEPLGDEDEEKEDIDDEDEEEQVVDTDEEEEKKIAHDSKKSFGATEKKTKVTDNSLIDEVADAWAKRYGGTK